MAKHLIIIAGPTATGKTDLAIHLASHYHTEIISADSRQFYQEMTIGTAKPTDQQLAKIKHHFINSLNINQEYSVGIFEKEAIQVLNQIFKTNDVAIMAGGSGLFIRAVCEGLNKFPKVSQEIKTKLDQQFQEHGLVFLQKELQEKDPIYYNQVDIMNPMRLLRALSVIRASNRPFSSFLNQKKEKRAFQPIYILLQMPREQLYERINQRVDYMIAAGLVEEVRELMPYRDTTAMRTIGYQEIIKYFDGDISLNTAIELIKQNSRRYAKRQMTWFRKRPHWQVFAPTEVERLFSFVAQKIKDSDILK